MSGDESPVVEARALTRRFGSRTVLDGLNLEIPRGEVFGFLGPNGAGKTTTIKLLMGLLQPTAGEVRLFGQRLADSRPRLLRRVGAMVEAPAFYPYLSGRDNLAVLARMAGVTRVRIDEVLELTGMSAAAPKRFGTYSVGMKQRLGMAAALLRNPDLLILDEPTIGLDPDGQIAFRKLVPWLADSGQTVFLSSHTLPEVQEICSRIGILKGGRLVAVDTVSSLLKGEPVVEVRVPDIAAAAEALLFHPWVRSVTPQGQWLAVQVPEDRIKDLNQALAGKGIFAMEIRVRERTLDAVYQEVMQGVAA